MVVEGGIGVIFFVTGILVPRRGERKGHQFRAHTRTRIHIQRQYFRDSNKIAASISVRSFFCAFWVKAGLASGGPSLLDRLFTPPPSSFSLPVPPRPSLPIFYLPTHSSFRFWFSGSLILTWSIQPVCDVTSNKTRAWLVTSSVFLTHSQYIRKNNKKEVAGVARSVNAVASVGIYTAFGTKYFFLNPFPNVLVFCFGFKKYGKVKFSWVLIIVIEAFVYKKKL